MSEATGPYDDWLVCMVSSRLHQAVSGFDEILRDSDPDFALSGLKVTSVIRISRLAVVEGAGLVGAVGEVRPERLHRVRFRLAEWMRGDVREASPPS